MKKDDSRQLPASRSSPELVNLMTEGIAAGIDSDATHDRMLSGLLDSIDFELSIRYGKRTELYREWLALPSVTLSQGASLLLGRDPLDPHSTEPEAPSEDLQRQQLSICNRLECEVIAGALKPIGKAVSGFDRRFSLTNIAQTALRVGAAESRASHILMLAEERGPVEAPPVAWQTDRVEQRIPVHRKLVALIRAKSPDKVGALAPKTRPNKNRRAKVEPINALIDMHHQEYDAAFRELYYREHGGNPGYHITGLMLRADRDQLNVKFKGGRPRQSAASAASNIPTGKKPQLQKRQ